MKIAIIGFSGSGKSTLAQTLGDHYHADVLHLDSVHFLPDWVERSKDEEKAIVEDFLNSHDSWIIDGTYTNLSFSRRMEEADQIIMMLFNRFDCLGRVTKRYRKFRNSRRPDMAEGCDEKLDLEFVCWVLWKGRSKAKRKKYKELKEKYPGKAVILKNQKQLDKFISETMNKQQTPQIKDYR